MDEISALIKETLETSSQDGSIALAGVAQWIEHWPVNQRVAGSIPSQDTWLGCRPGPQLGACKRQPQIDVSVPFSFPHFPSLSV